MRLRWRRHRSTGTGELVIRIEQFSFFFGFVVLRGSAVHVGRRISGIGLRIGGHDVRTRYDKQGTAEFVFRGEVPFDEQSFRDPQLVVTYAGGDRTVVEDFINPELSREAGHRLFDTFIRRVAELPGGAVLEIGARARSGVTRRRFIPERLDYVGFDIVAGENVDCVGDAHTMSREFAPGRFGAVMSFSVFEHLAMPWKVVLEMNKVMALNGIGYIQTHQSWPLHEVPWDFWRFSLNAWAALFNEATGFRIIEVGGAEPVMMVAKRWHGVVNFGRAEGIGLSAVLVEKVAETSLVWDVDPAAIVVDRYPY